MATGRYTEALAECDRAVEARPSFAEAYRTRARARLAGRQTGGLEEDLFHFEMFSRVLPPSLWGGSGPAAPLADAGLIGAAPSDRPALAVGRRRAPRAEAPVRDREDLEARAKLAEALRQARFHPLAFSEYSKVLAIQPNHIPARIARAEQAILDGQFDEARIDLAVVFDAPGLEDYVRRYPRALIPLLDITRMLLNVRRLDEARWVAERTHALAVRCRRDVGRSHYHYSQVYAALGASDPEAIPSAAKHLFRAFVANLEFVRWYHHPNPWFDPVRTRIDAALGRMEDPATVRRRLIAAAGKPSH